MWGSLKTIVSQYYYTQEETEKKTTDDIEGWVFVDKSGKEIEKETADAELLDSPRKFCESRLSPLPLLDISNTSSSQSSPQLSPTKIEEGWLIAPPPCFTLNCPSIIEISPLEDLLIEHPSMSVYGQFPSLLLSDKKEDFENIIPEECKFDIDAMISSDEDIGRDIESEQRVQSMPPALRKKSPKRETTTSKSHHDLAILMNQVDSAKPAQHAKWEIEQHKLCPSYMIRQNRVHRYQSRKHHNQKKKSLSKPFAEKGRHSF